MMAEFNAQIRHDLARLRARSAPSMATKQRMFAALELELGGPPPDDFEEPLQELGPDPAGATSPIVHAAKIVAATLGLTGAGLVVVRVAAMGVLALSPPNPSAPDSTADATVQVDPAPATPAVAPPPTPSEVAALPDASPSPEHPKSPRTNVGTPEQPHAEALSSPSPEDPLSVELSLLRAARNAPDPKASLHALEQHHTQFPAGQLAAERELMRVEALCTLDRLDEVREVRKRFAIDHRDSPLASRMGQACPQSKKSP